MSYPQHRIAFIAFIIFTGIGLAGCKKSDGGSRITIDGFYITDVSGNHVGHHGPFDEDWIFGNTATAEELALFNFPVTVTLDNTTEATVNGQLVAYPNPVSSSSQTYHGNVSDSVVFRLVVVNDNLQVLYKTAVKVKGTFDFQVNYSDRSTFPDKSSLRVYYSVSALNKPNYKTGYGDIKICDNTSGNCF
jgi:hypothetical protein